MTWHEPFDLYYWFVNVFAGNMTMFLAIAFFLIAMISGMFRFPVIITGLFFAIFTIMIAVQAEASIVVMVLVIVGLLLGWALTRFINR